MISLFNKNIADASFIGLLIFSPYLAFAHGEDKPGPHGGHIRMPGAFHTEVVPVEKDKAKIYLLDSQWKNPSLKGKVDARLENRPAVCKPREDHFLCLFPKGSDLSEKGTIIVRADREGLKGVEVFYELPFQNTVPTPQSIISGKNLLTGKQADVSAGKKGTVLVFMSAQCPCSNSHVSLLKKLAEEFNEFSFAVVHANADEPIELSMPYFQKAGFSFPVIEDEQGKIAGKFKALKTPHAYLIDPAGSVVYKGGMTNSSNGESASQHFLQDALTDVDAGRTVKTREGRTLGCLISRGEKHVY